MDEKDWAKIALWAIFGVLIIIAGLLNNIAGTLKDIYDAEQYTSASADYLKNIQDILEDIRNQ